MADQPTDEAVPVEAVIGPNSLPIVRAESNSSEYRIVPQFIPRTPRWTSRGDTGTRGYSATIPGLAENVAADVGGPPVFRKRRTDNHLFVPRDVDGVREVLGL